MFTFKHLVLLHFNNLIACYNNKNVIAFLVHCMDFSLYLHIETNFYIIDYTVFYVQGYVITC